MREELTENARKIIRKSKEEIQKKYGKVKVRELETEKEWEGMAQKIKKIHKKSGRKKEEKEKRMLRKNVRTVKKDIRRVIKEIEEEKRKLE